VRWSFSEKRPPDGPHSDEFGGILIDEPQFFDRHVEEQNDIADYLYGMVARRDGKPLDHNKSAAWQRGWTYAQE
jgi:hypothetical protein